MKFKSQICTTIEQSKKLLELGLKKETADMCFFRSTDEDVENPYTRLVVDDYILNSLESDDNIPAWSLHRLLSIMPTTFKYYNEEYGEECERWLYIDMPKSVRYENFMMDWEVFNKNEELYDNIIDCIEYLVKNELLNEHFLNI